jgi:general secretion pathway protein G
LPDDAWGHAFVWRNPGAANEAEIVSLGSDGKVGGNGEAADLIRGF